MKKILFTFLLCLFFERVYAIENIIINNDNLIPKFSKDMKKYNYFTELNEVYIDVKSSNDETVLGSGLFEIKDGINTFKINSNIDGDYLINIFKNYKEDKESFGKLIDLKIKNYPIDFNPEVYEYEITIGDEDYLDIDYELLNDSSYVEIDGNGNFNSDKNVIAVNVDNINTYKINVFKTIKVFKEETKIINEVEEMSPIKKEIVKLTIITISCSLVFIMFYLLFIKHYV